MWKNTKAFYDSSKWKKFRELLITKYMQEKGNEKIVCEECGERIDNKKITLHHIQEITNENVNDVNISLNPDNIKILCHHCHNREHGRFGYRSSVKSERGIYIVYGPPLSGKTSYVLNNKGDNDIVVDIDSIYEAITMLPRYVKPDSLKHNVFAVKNTLIDNIKTRYGSFRSAWIIGGYPNKVERERLAKQLGADLIYIKATKEECLNRLNNCNDKRSSDHSGWESYIERWFDDYLE